MAKGANQKIKILYLMRILLTRTDDRHGLTLEELTAALSEYGIEAERKTLYDDLDTLRVFGLDIEKRKSQTVTYHVVSRTFELPELKFLVDAVQSSKFITRKKSNELIKKLASLTSRQEAQQLERHVYVANRIKTMNESIYYIVDDLHRAMNENVQITFQYFNWNEQKERILRHDGARYQVSPWALTWDDENYYLIGYDAAEEKVKHYRVDKMLKIQLTQEKRDGAALFEDFDMALYAKKTFGMFGGLEEEVILHCHNRLAGIIIDRFGQDVFLHKVSDTHFEAHIKVQTSPHFYTWTMNFGSDLTVAAPDHVRAAIADLAAGIAHQYDVSVSSILPKSPNTNAQ